MIREMIRRKLATAVMVAALGSAVFVSCAARDPFIGTWKLNLSQSKLPAPLPQSQIVTIHITDQIIRVQEDVVSEKGEKLAIKVHAKFDGLDYAIDGSPFADTVAYTRVDRNTLKGIGKKGGKVIVDEVAVVSGNGKTLTTTYSGTDSSGQRGTFVAVFDRH
jgi:hypothetical protein